MNYERPTQSELLICGETGTGKDCMWLSLKVVLHLSAQTHSLTHSLMDPLAIAGLRDSRLISCVPL